MRAHSTEVVSPSSASPATVRRRRLRQRGFSLVELSVVVTITGVLATLATYSVRDRMYSAHSIEAVSVLGNIRSGILASSDDLSGNSASTLQIGGRVGGFGGPLGLPGVLGKNNGNGNGNSGNGNSGNSGSGNSGNSGNGNSGNGNSGNGNSGNSGSGGCDDDSGGKGGGNKDGGIDGDGNNGHGNNADGCDPDNPGNGGKNCGGDDDSSSNSGNSGNSGNSSSGSGSGSGSGSNSGSGSGSGSGNSGSGSGSGNSGSGSGDSGSGASSSANVDADNTVCSSADPVPSSLGSVTGRRYQSRPSDWSGTSSAGWRCLNVNMSGPQRFQYGYDVGATGAPASATPAGADTGLAAWARGDLDGDGRTSWYVLNGASYDGRVVMSPAVDIIDQGE